MSSSRAKGLIWTFPFTSDFPWSLFDYHVRWILHFPPLVLRVVPIWSLTVLGTEHRGRRNRFYDSYFVGTKFISWNSAWLFWRKLANGFPRAKRCSHLSHRSLPLIYNWLFTNYPLAPCCVSNWKLRYIDQILSKQKVCWTHWSASLCSYIADECCYKFFIVYPKVWPTRCNVIQLYFYKLLYMFRVDPPSIIRSITLYLHHLLSVKPLLLPAAIVEELERSCSADTVGGIPKYDQQDATLHSFLFL